eukprot:gnl/MRDRNA2_/MRDRNA2_133851_c0_seq1.p1 gnl/MRDRNA2_/MRDRNA2_133851_c0~~gnl/MRDRNA2_/MRDRNA2_133851_c0_seq1.p1  ORF type:complete len:408 (-),score=61.53 gnl/MRDRNA2_/MRDRNA2_133851_c0_seq1:344-1450(-)
MAGMERTVAELLPLAQKRIMAEMRLMEKERKGLEESGIFINWDDNDFSKAVAMITGPEDTPYAHGFFFFDIQFPDNYPMYPPKVTFMTGDGRVRFNPNLYVDGKVCLSILGTWQGPSWNSQQSLRTVLFSIQSLLNEHPIQNEPGYEHEKWTANDVAYSEIISYETIAVGVVRMLQKTPDKCQTFQDSMRQTFLKHFDDFLRTLEMFESKENCSTTKCPIYSFPIKYQTKGLIAELHQLRQSLQSKEMHPGLETSAVTGDSLTQTKFNPIANLSQHLQSEELHPKPEILAVAAAAPHAQTNLFAKKSWSLEFQSKRSELQSAATHAQTNKAKLHAISTHGTAAKKIVFAMIVVILSVIIFVASICKIN